MIPAFLAVCIDHGDGEVIAMKAGTSEDRRHLERFSLHAHAIVQEMSDDDPHEFELITQDVSSGGAYFPMEVPLASGERLKITLFLSILPFEANSEPVPTTEVVTKGTVVRSDEHGMAVQFFGRCLMSPVCV